MFLARSKFWFWFQRLNASRIYIVCTLFEMSAHSQMRVEFLLKIWQCTFEKKCIRYRWWLCRGEMYDGGPSSNIHNEFKPTLIGTSKLHFVNSLLLIHPPHLFSIRKLNCVFFQFAGFIWNVSNRTFFYITLVCTRRTQCIKSSWWTPIFTWVCTHTHNWLLIRRSYHLRLLKLIGYSFACSSVLFYENGYVFNIRGTQLAIFTLEHHAVPFLRRTKETHCLLQ